MLRLARGLVVVAAGGGMFCDWAVDLVVRDDARVADAEGFERVAMAL